MSFIHHIFLSYSRRDTTMMQKVRDDLRGAGFIVWTDEGLEVGTSSWERDIENAIRNTGCLVVLLSPDANQSEWVGREFTFANIHKKRIFPMLLRGDETTAIPLRLAQHNYVDIRQNYDDGMARMMRDIRKHLAMPQPTPVYSTPPPPPKPVYTPPPKPVEKPIENDFVAPRTSAGGAKRGFPVFVVIGGIVGVLALVLLLASGALSGNNSGATSRSTNTPRPITISPLPTFSSQQMVTITSNADWTPQERDFDGVTMVLVPAGCFMMGSTTGESDEAPVHEQCFDTPFWIDTYEVTQAQFAEFGGQKANANNFTGNELPVESITWFEARDYCELRGGRLPTEREWEYAARGSNNLTTYPWGNDFVADNVVYSNNSNRRTAPVGSRAGGVSWVGAIDMSGNVLEWVSSLYGAYPYDETDENISNNSSVRVLRGGSWYSILTDVRSVYRGGSTPTVRGIDVGLRCVRSQE